LKWSAGRPVAIIDEKLADKLSIQVDDRIKITGVKNQIISVVDTACNLTKMNEIAVSKEVLHKKFPKYVDIELAPKPESISLIRKKMQGKTLSQTELKTIMKDISDNALTESEIAYFISAVYKSKTSIKEAIKMIKAILSTGKTLPLHSGIIADKHSIGGVPGRVTPILVSICASAGLIIPKTSSRAITSAAGTADAMEVICQVNFSIPEMLKIIKKTNACLVWGGSLNLAPADDKLIRVERLLNLDPETQLLASILAKKLSVNSKYIVIDIPYGKNAKVTKTQAERLSKEFKQIAKYFKVNLETFLKKTEKPLGNSIGPSLEIQEVLSVLKREKDAPPLLEKRALELSGLLLELTKKAKKGKGEELAKTILDSGKAFKKFKQIVEAQNGDVNKKFQKTKFQKTINSNSTGKIYELKIKELNNIARIAGCPGDKNAGMYLYKTLDDRVKKHQPLLTIYSESKVELKDAIKQYHKTRPIRIK